VADNARPPVAVRIVRPYPTEEAFLENELETVGKTSVILIGAHSRPTGVILRFEVTLASGATVLRGEGRVLAHKENAFRGQPGLALRFTRLDPKSKALVDRAAAIREARLTPSNPPPPPDPPSEPRQAEPTPEPAHAEPPPPPSASAPSGYSQSMPPDPVLTELLTAPTPSPEPVRANANAKEGRRSIPPGRRSERPSQAPPPEADSQLSLEVQPVAQDAAATDPPEAPPVEIGSLPELPPSTPAIAVETLEVPESEGATTETAIVHLDEAHTIAESGSEEPHVEDAPTAVEMPAEAPPLSPPPPRGLPNREDLLSRLRLRAAALTPEQRARILRSS
jgi:hypothetical protein